MLNWISKLIGGNKGVLGHKDVTSVDVMGRSFRCQVCGCRNFWRHDVMLNTRAATFLDLDWMNKDAVCAVCDNCGYMHWFIPPQQLKEEETDFEDVKNA